MGDDGGSSAEQFELRRVGDNDRVAGKRAELLRIQAPSKRQHELYIKRSARLGDAAEDRCVVVLQGAKRGINEAPTIEPLPGEVNLRALLPIEEWSRVTDDRGNPFPSVELERRWKLCDLSKGR